MKFTMFKILFFFAAMFVVGGCAAPRRAPVRVCTGAESVKDAISGLRSWSSGATSFRGNGRCVFQYRERAGIRRESFPVKLWVNPPTEVRLQGDVAFDPKAVVLGANKDEFWISIKPEQIGNAYYWGLWSQAGEFEDLLSPEFILEGFGVTIFAGQRAQPENWSLLKEGIYDVLVSRDVAQRKRRVYIDSCNQRVGKIEYIGSDGRPEVITELGGYKKISEGFYVPSAVKIVNCSAQKQQDWVGVTVSLDSVKAVTFGQQLHDALFTRPQPRGFKHKYEIIDGRIVEQP